MLVWYRISFHLTKQRDKGSAFPAIVELRRRRAGRATPLWVQGAIGGGGHRADSSYRAVEPATCRARVPMPWKTANQTPALFVGSEPRGRDFIIWSGQDRSQLHALQCMRNLVVDVPVKLFQEQACRCASSAFRRTTSAPLALGARR